MYDKHPPNPKTGNPFPVCLISPFVLPFMELLFLYLTGYKAKVTKDPSQLKMLEIFQIQTRGLMSPHKIPKACTVHIVLRLPGPLPLFQSDTHRVSAAQISTGTILFSTTA